jgi:hypothetical protein
MNNKKKSMTGTSCEPWGEWLFKMTYQQEENPAGY